MALMDEDTECPICGERIQATDRFVATTHFIEDRQDPLWQFSDAAMHYECFQTWPLRMDFVRRYREVMGVMTSGNGTYYDMSDDGTIVVRERATGRVIDLD